MLARNELLRVGPDQVPFEVRLSPRRRTLSIEVHPEPRVIVRAPAGCPPAVIQARLSERAQWIGRQVQRFRGLAAGRPPAPGYVSGDVLLYVGEPHRLEVGVAGRPAVNLHGGAIRVGVPAGATPDHVRRALDTWYRARAAELFTAILAERFDWFHERGHPRPTLKVRKMTTRWGTLAGPVRRGPTRRLLARWTGGATSRVSRMTLNLALIHAPRECSEFVVVHELCHLEHRGHGRDFYRLMEQRMPDWRERKHRLESLLVL